MREKIRFSTRYLGIQLFTFFINWTGWDSIGFSFPFWIFYIFLRGIEKAVACKSFTFKRTAINDTKFLAFWLILNVVTATIYYQEVSALKLGFYYLVGGLFFLCVVDAKLSHYEIDWLLDKYVMMSILAAFLLFVQRIPVPTYTNRLSLSILGHLKDPNYFSAYIMFPCLICLYRYMNLGQKKWLFSFLTIAGAILLTGSRSSFLALSLGVSIILVGTLKNKRALGKILMFAIVFSIALFAILPDNLIMRLTDFNTYHDRSNRLRLNIWTAAIEIWKEHPFWGAGQNVVANHCVDYGAYLHMMTHSTYLDILAEFGLIGFFLFLYVPLKNMIRSIKRKNVLVFAGITTTLMVSAILSAQYSQYYWINLAIFYSMLSNAYVRSRDRYKGDIKEFLK